MQDESSDRLKNIRVVYAHKKFTELLRSSLEREDTIYWGKRMRKIFLILAFIHFSATVLPAVQYTTNLSTYYLSPLGSYEALYLKPKSFSMSEPCKIGTIYYDPNGKFMVCQNDKYGTGGWVPSILWNEDSNNIYLTDTAVNPALFIGLGTKTPEFKLSLEGDGGIIAKGTFGSGEVLSTTGAGTRLIWYPRKGAFRAGGVNGNHWNDANIGNYSFATGFNTRASNDNSTAMGYETTASGLYSTAMGYQTIASGYASTAMGNQTTASGYASTAFGYKTTANGNVSTAFGVKTVAGPISTAMGYKTIASGFVSIAMGSETIASGENSITMGNAAKASGKNSIAMGNEAKASGENSIAMGEFTTASGLNSISMVTMSHSIGEGSCTIGYSCLTNADYSLAMGRSSTADGTYSMALGYYAVAQAYNSLVIGAHNIVEGDKINWVNTDPLFVIGNGINNLSKNNALTVLKNGNVGIGTNNPTASLSVIGVPEHADNAAAVAAGLPSGSFYRTGDLLKVVH